MPSPFTVDSTAVVDRVIPYVLKEIERVVQGLTRSEIHVDKIHEAILDPRSNEYIVAVTFRVRPVFR